MRWLLPPLQHMLVGTQKAGGDESDHLYNDRQLYTDLLSELLKPLPGPLYVAL